VSNVNEIENLLKATINEMEKLLISKVVVGEPVESGGTTVVPLLSVSFGFGGGAGSGKDESAGTGGGAAGGFKMKPVSVIVIEKDQTRVVPLEKSEIKYPLIEGLMERIPHLIKELKDRDGREPKEGKEIKVE